jgi:hypothetical protein
VRCFFVIRAAAAGVSREETSDGVSYRSRLWDAIVVVVVVVVFV